MQGAATPAPLFPGEAALGIVDWHTAYTQPTPFYYDFPGATSGSGHGGPLTTIHVDWVDRGTLPGNRYQMTVSSLGRAAGYGTTYGDKNNGWVDVAICEPGSTPGPDVPTPPAPTRPPGVPDAPAPIACTADDICKLLRDLLYDVGILSAELLSLRKLVEDDFAAVTLRLVGLKDDVTLLKPLVETDITAKVGCPVVSVTGKLPAVLGELFSKSRLLCPRGATAGDTFSVATGLEIALPAAAVGVGLFVENLPSWLALEPGIPTWTKLGHVAFGTAAGYGPRTLISYVHSLWLPLPAGTTKLTVWLEPPMSATGQIYIEVVP